MKDTELYAALLGLRPPGGSGKVRLDPAADRVEVVDRLRAAHEAVDKAMPGATAFSAFSAAFSTRPSPQGLTKGIPMISSSPGRR